MNGRSLVMAAVSLLAAVALILVPYGRDLSAIGGDGAEIDIDISVACPAPVVGAFQIDEGAGWFNYSPADEESGSLCRTSAFWRLGAAMVLFFLGWFFLHRGLKREGEPSDSVTESA